MLVERLCQFIDMCTNNGSRYPINWQEGIRTEDEGIELINAFSAANWLSLQEYIKNKSNCWVESLLYLLDEANTPQARQIIIYIALNGTSESFLDAIDHIRDAEEYKKEITQDTWIKLEARSTKIICSRLGLKFID